MNARSAASAESFGVVEATSRPETGEPWTLITRLPRPRWTRRPLSYVGTPSANCRQRTVVTPARGRPRRRLAEAREVARGQAERGRVGAREAPCDVARAALRRSGQRAVEAREDARGAGQRVDRQVALAAERPAQVGASGARRGARPAGGGDAPALEVRAALGTNVEVRPLLRAVGARADGADDRAGGRGARRRRRARCSRSRGAAGGTRSSRGPRQRGNRNWRAP